MRSLKNNTDPLDDAAAAFLDAALKRRQPCRRSWRTRALRIVAYTYPPLRAVSFRYRHQFWPVTILLALLQARLIASWYEPVTVAAVALLVAGLVAFHLRRRLDRRIEWMYALSCLSAAVLGVVFGRDSQPLTVLCVLGWWIGACIWWLHHRRGVPASLPTDTFIDRWIKRIGITE